MDAMNVMYEVEEARPKWKRYLLSVLLSLGTAALLLFALALIVFGPHLGAAVGDTVGLGSAFLLLWNVVQWPVLFCEVLLAFSLVYYFAPDVEQRFRWVSLGSIIAVTLWIVFSVLFSLYTNNFVDADPGGAGAGNCGKLRGDGGLRNQCARLGPGRQCALDQGGDQAGAPEDARDGPQ